MDTFGQFITNADFISLSVALTKAKADGYKIEAAEGFDTGAKLTSIPKELQDAPDGLWKYKKGTGGDFGQIALYEPGKKGKFNLVDTWFLKTQADLDIEKIEAEQAAADDEHFKTHVRPQMMAFYEKVFDAAQEALKKHTTLFIGTMTHRFQISKAQDLKWVKNQGIQMLRGYKKTKPIFVWLGPVQIEQLAQQLKVDRNKI